MHIFNKKNQLDICTVNDGDRELVTIHCPVKVLEDCLKEHADNVVAGRSEPYSLNGFDNFVYLFFPIDTKDEV